MTPETRAKLEAADVEGWYVPYDDWAQFPYQIYQNEVKLIRCQINAELDLELQSYHPQDASYFEELFVSGDLNDKNARQMQLCIMFSNFGKLFTIWSSYEENPDNLARFNVSSVRRTTEKHGWIYVPVWELRAPYDGRYSERTQKSKFLYTWLIRFFSYV